ncbi:MAG TPA: hypothetical protein VF375_02180 [Candidatus Limnocylindrales bacterium]
MAEQLRTVQLPVADGGAAAPAQAQAPAPVGGAAAPVGGAVAPVGGAVAPVGGDELEIVSLTVDEEEAP